MSIEDKIFDLNFQRKAAKVTLGVSMGITALTALNMNSRMSQLHKISGAVMLASAIWHASLYGSPYSEFLQNRKAKALALRNEDLDFITSNMTDVVNVASDENMSSDLGTTKIAPKKRHRTRRNTKN
ncbi:hypothetical protein [Campylobacter gracilis]|uniref:Uncharacterized protein n=1 Tax=Campylobacter gracilis RM3268 TaxID=553220 RepID=C8PIR5_9BACT|nr:hypothetical protein [Campylobacter gracilis]AKT92466.1 hypothetical protein CGRAC_1016 [Campylobacter gracilis]EEV16820.1 hypothetical protein CAMGR0001_1114 [Campylobacter gracilis RM3268]UEB45354.1 hypothetical protein LK410_10265 [Campylobacter gracilis]SUW81981.1 Uncharacterised protein [Campylobacter gracilis]